MVGSPTMNPNSIHKAISALLPHAISLEQSGDQAMVDAIFRVARTPYPWTFMWRYVEPYMVNLLNEPTPPSLNRATTLLTPYIPWHYWDINMASRWATAASTVQYSKEVGQSVVPMLLWLAGTDTLRSSIPIDVWAWLKKQPSLPPPFEERYGGTRENIVRHIRGLGDRIILKSYFILVWSEWDTLDNSGFSEMRISILGDLNGVGMRHHREDLIGRLDYILGEVDRGLEHLKQHKPWIAEYEVQMRKKQYGSLREVLLQVDRRAMEKLARTSQLDRFQQVH